MSAHREILVELVAVLRERDRVVIGQQRCVTSTWGHLAAAVEAVIRRDDAQIDDLLLRAVRERALDAIEAMREPARVGRAPV